MLYRKSSRVQNQSLFSACCLLALWNWYSWLHICPLSDGLRKVFLHKSPYSLYILLRCYRYQPCFPLTEKIWVKFRTLYYITQICCHWRTDLCFWVREKPSFLSCSYMSMNVGACWAHPGNPPGQAGTTTQLYNYSNCAGMQKSSRPPSDWSQGRPQASTSFLECLAAWLRLVLRCCARDCPQDHVFK